MSNCAENAVCVLELQRPFCSQDFGVTCDGTGDPCYGTWATCKDKCNYECTTNSLYFSTCKLPIAYGIRAEPTLSSKSIQRRGTKLNSSGLSDRGYTILEIEDKAHNDVGLDPYWPRATSPGCATDMPGTYWSRLIARQCWFDGMKAILHTGDCSMPFQNFSREVMYVESLDGTPGRKNGKIRLRLQDPLFLLSGATCPREEDFLAANQIVNFQSQQPLYLGVDMDGSPSDQDDEDDPNALLGQTLLAINYVKGDPDQDRRIAAIKHLCIGKEIVEVEPIFVTANPAGWNFKLIERGSCGSEIGEHKAGAIVQAAETFSDIHVADAVHRIIKDCARIEDIAQNCCDENDCLISSFDEYRCANPLQIICGDVVICKGQNASKMIKNMAQVFGFDIFFNTKTNLIEMRSECLDVSDEPPVVIPNKIISGFSLKQSQAPLSHVIINHSPSDWTELDTESNLPGKTIAASEDSLREPCNRRTIRKTNTETINTFWINECNEYLAKTAAYRKLRAREKPIYEASMELPKFATDVLEVGQLVFCESHSIPTVDGLSSDSLWQVTSLTEGKILDKITIESTHYNANIIKCIECPDVQIVAAADECEELDCPEIC